VEVNLNTKRTSRSIYENLTEKSHYKNIGGFLDTTSRATFYLMTFLVVIIIISELVFIKKIFQNKVSLFYIIFIAFNVCYFTTVFLISQTRKIKSDRLTLLLRVIEMVFISLIAIPITPYYWIIMYILVIFPVFISLFKWGVKIANYLIILAFSINFVINLIVQIFFSKYIEIVYNNLYILCISNLVIYIAIFSFVNLCKNVYVAIEEKDKENIELVNEVNEKYSLLEIAQKEIKMQYEKIKETNTELEDSNDKLTSSIAEFFTLQQITQGISSIFDINELLKFVNDVILGVMGVNYSTILTYDIKKQRLIVHTTNVVNKNELALLTDTVNCSILKQILLSNEPLLENFADEKEFPFISSRPVNSIICVPLFTKSQRYGLVLIEHTYTNAFDEDNVRFINTIGQQVSIAMENTQLYQKMTELATIDGLTQIYNRLYFQEKLKEEYAKAMQNNYDISVLIFDIDHFKRFNDTFGHIFGDEVLKTLAKIVKPSLRKDDVFARFGGEEFIILLPRTSLKNAYEKAEELRMTISKCLVKDNYVSASVTVSIGVSSFPETAQNEMSLLKTADNALYSAKEAGRNCVKVADSIS